MTEPSTAPRKPSDTLAEAGAAAEAKGNTPVDAAAQPCAASACPPPLAKPAAAKQDIDWKFISDREGGQVLVGYVPAANVSKSGVTVGTGIDLGARSEADIDKLGLDAELAKKLKPYAGKQAKDATDYLKEHPLTLTEPEASSLDKAVKQPLADKMIKEYNAAVAAANKADGCCRVTFEELPQGVQTAVMSTSFQYGSLNTATPTYWKQVTEQRWKDASDNLKKFGDAYPSRRKLEAEFVDAAISAAPKVEAAAAAAVPAGAPPVAVPAPP